MFIDELARKMCEGNQIDVAVMDFSITPSASPEEAQLLRHQRIITEVDRRLPEWTVAASGCGWNVFRDGTSNIRGATGVCPWASAIPNFHK